MFEQSRFDRPRRLADTEISSIDRLLSDVAYDHAGAALTMKGIPPQMAMVASDLMRLRPIDLMKRGNYLLSNLRDTVGESFPEPPPEVIDAVTTAIRTLAAWQLIVNARLLQLLDANDVDVSAIGDTTAPQDLRWPFGSAIV